MAKPGNKKVAIQTVSWTLVALIVFVVALTYANTLSHPFIFDDQHAIVENEQIRDLTNLSAVLSPARELPTAGRPVVNLTFAVNYALGGLTPAGYHVWNIATHLACALLLFGIVRRTIANLPNRIGDSAGPIACAVALIWAVHPLNTEAVNYVTQRTELTMAALLLATLYASIRALGESRRSMWTMVAIAACALGMASKESMVTAPVLVVLYDRIFAFRSWRNAWTARRGLYVGLAATWLVLAGLLATGPRTRSAGFTTGVSPGLYLINQLPIVTRYLWLAFWPHALVVNYGWPQSMSIASVLPYAVIIGVLVVLTLIGFRKWPMLAFLGAWIWITLAPTSSIVPIATEVGAERRMYLPLMAVVTLVVVGLTALMLRASRTAKLTVLATLVVVLAGTTIVRNADYASPLVLARKTVDRYPTPVAHQVLGTELLAVGQREDAIAELRRALPGAPRAHYTLGVELLEDGKTEEGIAELRAFIREQPFLALVGNAHEYLGRMYAQRQQWVDAIAEFQAVLAIAPNADGAERLLAGAFFGAGDMHDAISHFEAHLRRVPGDADALNQYGIALGTAGRLDDAIAAFTRAGEINPQDGAVQRNLAYTLYQKKDITAALVHAQRAVALQPNDAESRSLLKMLQEIRKPN